MQVPVILYCIPVLLQYHTYCRHSCVPENIRMF